VFLLLLAVSGWQTRAKDATTPGVGGMRVVGRGPDANVSITHAAWGVDAVHGVHAMYSVRKLGTASADCTADHHFHHPLAVPGSLVVVRKNAWVGPRAASGGCH
jgi:hypothetical protein